MNSYLPLLVVSIGIVVLISGVYSSITIEGMNKNVAATVGPGTTTPLHIVPGTQPVNNGTSIQKDTLGNITFICDNAVHQENDDTTDDIPGHHHDDPEHNTHRHYSHSYGTFDVTPSACSYHGFG